MLPLDQHVSQDRPIEAKITTSSRNRLSLATRPAAPQARTTTAAPTGALAAFAKTSGSKGIQLYAAIETSDPAAPSVYAKTLAQQLAREAPDKVTAVMAKNQRTGRVFIDWSQNNPKKTTIAAYSLRGRDRPTVSTPITWAEVETCTHAAQLAFTADDVLDRVQQHGDLLGSLDDSRAPLSER